MNVDVILETFHRHRVAFLLIGGMNFLLRHKPVLTFDIDVWIEDEPDNRRRCEVALAELEAEWGPSDAEWGKVARRTAGWLESQGIFCLTSPHGAIDVFRQVRGLPDWRAAAARARDEQTAGGARYRGLSDEDMLASQLALDESDRRPDRIRVLREALERRRHDG